MTTSEHNKEALRKFEDEWSKKTPFEIVKAVVQFIYEQGPSYIGPDIMSDNDSKTCAYRGTGGRKCAVGYIIPDEVYSSEFETESPFVLTRYLLRKDEEYDEYLSLLRKEVSLHIKININLYNALQALHDNFSSWDSESAFTVSLRYTIEDVLGLKQTNEIISSLKNLKFKKGAVK